MESIEFGKLLASILLVAVAIIYYIFQPALGQKPFDKDNIIQEHLSIRENNDNNGDKRTCSNDNDGAGNDYLLSLIIPAYNEEERLPPMLESTIEYLHTFKDTIVQQCQEALAVHEKNETNKKIQNPFQIIIVNDGSTDTTVKSAQNILHKISTQNNKLLQSTSITILTLQQNSGKGAAVKAGMLHSTTTLNSKLSLMLDADGATTFSSLHSLLQDLNSNPNAQIAFGSRAHLQEASKAQRSFTRTILMNAFHFFVEQLVGGKIKDTQCGFKLFRGAVVGGLFHNLHLQRWAFDTELIVIAERFGFEIVEVGVEWQEVDGSKLHTGKIALIVASAGMLRDMICVRACYSLGFWKLKAAKID